MFNKYDYFIFDIDGTIILGDSFINSAVEAISNLIDERKNLFFLSNKTTDTVEDFYQLFISNSININRTDFLNSTIVISKYLNDKYLNHKFFAIAENQFIEAITDCGLVYSENPSEIDIVIISLDRDINKRKIEIAKDALLNGAKFFAANTDSTCPEQNCEISDSGNTIRLLENLTERKLEKNFGKPSNYMITELKNNFHFVPEKTLLIGDRLETDIALANKIEIDSALVKSGVKNDSNLVNLYSPTFQINSVADLLTVQVV